MKRTHLILGLWAAAGMLVLGCGGGASLDGTVPVSGTVKQKGAALEGATVTFSPAGQGTARAASGKTDASGNYKLTTLKPDDGAFPGEYEVIVTKTEMVGKTYTPEEANDYYAKNKKSPPPPQVKQLLPEKYSRSNTSGFKASVKQGAANQFNFDLE